MDSGVDWKLTELLDSKGYDQSHELKIKVSHLWCNPGVNTA